MKKLLCMELNRALFNAAMLAALLVGIILSVSHVIQYIWPMAGLTAADFAEANKGLMYPNNVFNSWMGMEGYSLQSYLYWLLIPLLAVLPFASSFFTDWKSGYIKNIYIRSRRGHYLTAKFLAVFISGGLAVVIPLLVNLGLTALMMPALLPQLAENTYPIIEPSMWSSLFLYHPFLYTFAYLAIDFIFAGLIATLSLAVSFFAENRFVILLCPFLLYIFLYSLCNMLGLQRFSPFEFLHPAQMVIPNVTFPVIAVETVMLGLITGLIFFLKGTRDDPL